MKLRIVFIFILLASAVHSQEIFNKGYAKPVNSNSGDGMGNYLAYNEISGQASSILFFNFEAVNYRRMLFHFSDIEMNIALGFGRAQVLDLFGGSQNNNYNVIPISIGFITGSTNNHFEFNVGIEPFLNSGNSGSRTINYPIFDIGYRYQDPTGGFIFRAFVGTEGLGLGVGGAF